MTISFRDAGVTARTSSTWQARSESPAILPTCFLESDYNVDRVKRDPEEEMAAFEAIDDWRKDSFVREVFERDTEGLRQSRKYVLLLPAGKSCHIEAGAAWAMGQPCILIGEQQEAERLYLIFEETYERVEQFVESLIDSS